MSWLLTAIAVQFLTGTASAASVKPANSVDLRERALSEIRQDGKQNKTSTDAQVAPGSGMLSLKDPMPEVRGRSWDYYLRLGVQSFQPRGSASNDLTSDSFQLGGTSAVAMPSLTFGFAAGLWKGSTIEWRFGLGARVAYSTEKGTARFRTGYEEPDVRLNSTILSGVPWISLRFARLPWMALNAGAEIGTLNYTQTSGNKLAAFSQDSPYQGWSTGLEFNLTPQWSLLADYVQRRLTRASRLELQKDNVEIGTRFVW